LAPTMAPKRIDSQLCTSPPARVHRHLAGHLHEDRPAGHRSGQEDADGRVDRKRASMAEQADAPRCSQAEEHDHRELAGGCQGSDSGRSPSGQEHRRDAHAAERRD
jgi:hypothetical protein